EERPQIRVDNRRRRPLVLAKLRGDLVRRHDVRFRIPQPELLDHSALVPGMPEREEEADADRLGVEVGQRRQVERLELARRAHAAPDADATLERYERRRVLLAGAIEVRPRLPAELEEVLEALRGDECGART